MARFAVAGIRHVSNSFVPSVTPWSAFAGRGAWPGWLRSDALPMDGRPASGFAAVRDELGHEILPLSWFEARPGGPVTGDSFAGVVNTVLGELAEQIGLDGVYLDLTGRMAAAGEPDADGAVAAHVRGLIGNDLPLVATVDRRANVSRRLVGAVDRIVVAADDTPVALRDAGAHAATILDAVWRGSRLYAGTAFVPFLIPPSAADRDTDAVRALETRRSASNAESAHVAYGWPFVDAAHTGPAILAYAGSQLDADRAAGVLAQTVRARETAFAVRSRSAGSGVAAAVAWARAGTVPVMVVDVQDDPGTGSCGDATSVLRAITACRAPATLLGVMTDSAAVGAAIKTGEGGTLTLALGGRSGLPDDAPYDITATITGIVVTGRGRRVVCLNIIGTAVEALVADGPVVLNALTDLEPLGVDPAAYAILVLKTAPDVGRDAAAVIRVQGAGWAPDDLTRLAYHHLRSGMRIGPGGPTFLGAPFARST